MWVHGRYHQTHQKRPSDLIIDDYEPMCGCWELNSGPLEEQTVLLTTEPSLQPHYVFIFKISFLRHRPDYCRRDSILNSLSVSGSIFNVNTNSHCLYIVLKQHPGRYNTSLRFCLTFFLWWVVTLVLLYTCWLFVFLFW